MSSAIDQRMTLEQFVAWEEPQELRHEFDGWQPVAMTGGTDLHEAIGGTLRALLQDRLIGKPFARQGAGWDAYALTEGESLDMPEIDVELALGAIYADVKLPDSDAFG